MLGCVALYALRENRALRDNVDCVDVFVVLG